MQLEFFRQIFQKYPNIKFHENLSSVSRVAASGRTGMMKLIVDIGNFANTPKSTLPPTSWMVKNRPIPSVLQLLKYEHEHVRIIFEHIDEALLRTVARCTLC
jgi:hypothetical protein